MLSLRTLRYYLLGAEIGINKLSIKYQSYPKSREIHAFGQEICFCHNPQTYGFQICIKIYSYILSICMKIEKLLISNLFENLLSYRLKVEIKYVMVKSLQKETKLFAYKLTRKQQLEIFCSWSRKAKRKDVIKIYINKLQTTTKISLCGGTFICTVKYIQYILSNENNNIDFYSIFDRKRMVWIDQWKIYSILNDTNII